MKKGKMNRRKRKKRKKKRKRKKRRKRRSGLAVAFFLLNVVDRDVAHRMITKTINTVIYIIY